MMNQLQKEHMARLLQKSYRMDGRKTDEYRDIKVEYDISKSAEGSARVTIGDTVVLAGVKMEMGKPYPDTPDSGSLMVGAELTPLASSEFELGPPSIKAIELGRVIDRCIRESKAIDTKKLCVQKGEKAWTVIIDIVPLNDAGNLFDAAALAAIAALKNTKFPAFDGETIDYKTKTDEGVPLSKTPIEITILKIGDTLLVDPTIEEEKVADARLTVAVDGDTICALQKGGDEALSIEETNAMVELAMTKAKELAQKL